MATSTNVTNNGLLMMQDRIYNSSATYSVPARFRIGLGTTTAAVTDTAIQTPVPISNGTVIDNGADALTGSAGGDNTTDNTTTFKQGAGQNDNTSQNLIANNTSASKTWTISTLDNNFTAAQPAAFWLFIKDTTAYNKFITSGTALELRVRTNGDAANRYYSYTRTAAQLAVLWNWVSTGTTNVNALTQGAGGAPSGTLNEFVLIITTNNATDTFTTGDVLYDLMRQWAAADLIKTFESGYPSLNTTIFETTMRTRLTATQANGFNISEFGLSNTDGTPLLVSHSTFNAVSKTYSDEIIIIEKHRITQL